MKTDVDTNVEVVANDLPNGKKTILGSLNPFLATIMILMLNILQVNVGIFSKFIIHSML